MSLDANHFSLMAHALLAQSRMGDISRQYREEGSTYPWPVQVAFTLIPVIAVGLAWTLYRLYSRHPSAVNTPFGMLAELCRAHQIPIAGRRLLERVAEHAELEQPASLMINARHFDQAVEAAEQRLRFDPRNRARLGEIRRRLFAN